MPRPAPKAAYNSPNGAVRPKGIDPRRWAAIRPFAESLAGIKASQIIGKAGLQQTDLEDVRQQLLLYLVSHLGDYDRRRGTPEAHVTMLITTAVALLLRSLGLQKHGGGKPPASLDVVTDGQRSPDEYLSPADYGRRLGLRPRAERDAVEMRLDLADALDTLPTGLRALAGLMVRGQMEASVARLSGRSRRQVRNDVEAIRAHLGGTGCSSGDAHHCGAARTIRKGAARPWGHNPDPR